MPKLIAVVDDEKDIVELICFHLKREGFKVKGLYDGESIVNWAKENQAGLSSRKTAFILRNVFSLMSLTASSSITPSKPPTAVY